MADVCDQADIQKQSLLDAAIRESSRKANFDMNGDGVCLSCGKIVEPVAIKGGIITPRWWSVEWRTIWDRE